MSFDAMTFVKNNKLRIVLCIFITIIVIQMLRLLPSLHSVQETDIDHGPSPEGSFVPVSIAVYYEALCPDSKNFIVRQLKPVIDKAHRLVTVSFVAYGKAKTTEDRDKNLAFTCQHGPTECLGNKVHACGAKKIVDPIQQADYIACMIVDNYEPLAIGKACADKLNIDWEPILRCATDQEGSLLLKDNGELTANLYPRVTFIPTVLLDNGQWNQAAILKNLLKEVCSHFKVTPEECQGVGQRVPSS